MTDDMSRDDAIVEQRMLVENIATSVPFQTTAQGNQNNSLVNWVNSWLQDESHLQSGSAITTLMRLPGPYWYQVARVLLGEQPYPSMALYITLKNVSSAPVDITYDVINRSMPVKTAFGFVDGDTWRGVPQTVSLAPGETYKLRGHYAVLAMQQYNQSVWDPMLWEESGAIPAGDKLQEVAYKCDIMGETVDSAEFTSRPKRRKTGSDG